MLLPPGSASMIKTGFSKEAEAWVTRATPMKTLEMMHESVIFEQNFEGI